MKNVALMSQAARDEALRTKGAGSLVNRIVNHIPVDAKIQPLTWAQLLQIPTSIPNRIYWAALSFDVARAEAIEYQLVGMNIVNQQLEAAQEAEAAQAASDARYDAPMNSDELAAGELDENYNSPLAMEELKKAEEVKNAATMAKAAAHLASVYSRSFEELYRELGIPADENDMTHDELREWVVEHEGEDLDMMREHVLNNLVDHAHEFGLEHVAMAESFVDHLCAMAIRGGKALKDLQNLAPDMIGNAYNKHHRDMQNTSNEMVQTAMSTLRNRGATPTATIAPTPQPSFREKMDKTLSDMSAPSLGATHDGMDPAVRWAQLRLAAIQVMHPNQHTQVELRAKFPAPVDGSAEKEPATLEQLHGQMREHAKKLGVNVQALGKAADATLEKQLWPNNPAAKAAMKETPVVAPEEKKPSLMKKAMQDSMKPGMPPY